MTESCLEGFKIVQIKYKEENEHTHQIFYKPHNVRVLEPSKPTDRTLFCANIPPWCDQETVRRLFVTYGSIEAVHMELEPSVGAPSPRPHKYFPSARDPYATGNGFKFAYVVFQRASSVRKSMTHKESSKVHVASTNEKPLLTGLAKWARDYNQQVVDIKELLADVHTYMTDFDEAEAKKKADEERLGEADEDGWVTVTKSSKVKTGKVRKEGDDDKSRKVRGKNRRRKKTATTLKNFYAHQIKSEKITHIEELRKKFEEDKLKIAKMKAGRKFRPF